MKGLLFGSILLLAMNNEGCGHDAPNVGREDFKQMQLLTVEGNGDDQWDRTHECFGSIQFRETAWRGREEAERRATRSRP